MRPYKDRGAAPRAGGHSTLRPYRERGGRRRRETDEIRACVLDPQRGKSVEIFPSGSASRRGQSQWNFPGRSGVY